MRAGEGLGAGDEVAKEREGFARFKAADGLIFG